MLTAEMSQLLEAWHKASEEDDAEWMRAVLPVGNISYPVQLFAEAEGYVQIHVQFPNPIAISEHAASLLFLDIEGRFTGPINLIYAQEVKQISAAYFAREDELEEDVPDFLSLCSRLTELFDYVGQGGAWDSALILLMLAPRPLFGKLQ